MAKIKCNHCNSINDSKDFFCKNEACKKNLHTEKNANKFYKDTSVTDEGISVHAEKIITTTAPSLEGYTITKTIEIVTSECVFGMNIFRDFFAGLRDIFGGRSIASQKVLRDARKECLREIKKEAYLVGGNAIIGVSLDYSEISGKAKSMLFLVASGTAVIVEPIKKEKK